MHAVTRILDSILKNDYINSYYDYRYYQCGRSYGADKRAPDLLAFTRIGTGHVTMRMHGYMLDVPSI